MYKISLSVILLIIIYYINKYIFDHNNNILAQQSRAIHLSLNYTCTIIQNVY